MVKVAVATYGLQKWFGGDFAPVIDLMRQADEAVFIGPAPASEQLARLPLELLQRGRYQPRSDVRSDTLNELAESIRRQGIIQPIVVRPVGGTGGEQRYEIIAGERRWRAAQRASRR